MKSSSAKVAFASVVGAVFLSWVFVTLRPASTTSYVTVQEQPGAARTQDDDSALQLQASLSKLLSSVEMLTTRVADLESRPTRDFLAHDAGASEAREERGNASHNGQQRPPSPEQTLAMVQARVRYFDNAFEHEERDPKWSDEMEQVVDKAFTEGNFKGTTLLSSACKQTFCRIEAEHADEQSSAQFEAIKHDVPGSFYMQRIDDGGDAPPRTLMYFLRGGHLDKNSAFTRLRQGGSFED